MISSLSLDAFELRLSDSVGAAWEEQFDERADIVLVGPEVGRENALSFVRRLREQFPTTIALIASGDRSVDCQSLQLASDHVDACAELRRRIAVDTHVPPRRPASAARASALRAG